MRAVLVVAELTVDAVREKHTKKQKTSTASKKVPVTPETSTTANAGRRRRRMEFIAGGRQASRAPSGSARQPIRRSAAPRNHPGQGEAVRQK
ncbi:unnamed protein product [Allacma fusca]|uniref:Uncharacterized protein n=1 Tax=Allacma fusca TaxID=39272 RepID=A0A8J2LJM3_9HEXA|nr:unnamed protein product [Allacma fusca]